MNTNIMQFIFNLNKYLGALDIVAILVSNNVNFSDKAKELIIQDINKKIMKLQADWGKYKNDYERLFPESYDEICYEMDHLYEIVEALERY